MQGAAYEATACGKVVCCEGRALVHAEECEVRVTTMQCSVPAFVWSGASPAVCKMNVGSGIVSTYTWAQLRSLAHSLMRSGTD